MFVFISFVLGPTNGKHFASLKSTQSMSSLHCFERKKEKWRQKCSFVTVTVIVIVTEIVTAILTVTELKCSSKFERSLGCSVIENVLKSCANELA
jgi:hypothetical protein